MQIIRFISQNNLKAEFGILEDDYVLSLSQIDGFSLTNIVDIINNWAEVRSRAERLRENQFNLHIDDVQLINPVDSTEKILAIGMNYADHIREVANLGVETPKEQVWFSKMPSSLNGPYDDVWLPKCSSMIDYEVELVAVIGKFGRYIDKQEAHKYVFGYCVGNDVTARDWQKKTPQWVLGKSFDTHAPIGPSIVTSEQIYDPHNLKIECHVNGELRQSSNTKYLAFNIWEQIEELSKVMTLKPGDLIFTGTPGGVGVAMDPPISLKSGDVVRCEIENIGFIENRFVNEDLVKVHG